MLVKLLLTFDGSESKMLSKVTIYLRLFLLLSWMHCVFAVLSFNQCTIMDSYFVKSSQGIEFLAVNSTTNSVWREQKDVQKEMHCSSLCHQRPSWCQSAIYNVFNKTCFLSHLSRMELVPGIVYIKSSNVSYFERQKCGGGGLKERFIALVPKAKDCADVRSMGWAIDGVYGIGDSGVTSEHYRSVLCQMSYLGGGWTVFQQRVDGVVSFAQDWKTYKMGFGSLDGSFWMGNDFIHQSTWPWLNNEIFVEMESPAGDVYFSMFDGFKVADEEDFYRLSVGNERPTGMGTSYTYTNLMNVHNNMKFSTVGIDNDYDDESCSENCGQGGWWYNACFFANPNGKYGQSWTVSQHERILWNDITYDGSNQMFALTRIKMMFRKAQ